MIITSISREIRESTVRIQVEARLRKDQVRFEREIKRQRHRIGEVIRAQ